MGGLSAGSLVTAFRHYTPKQGEPICRYERFSNTLFFSVHDMYESRLGEYVEAFKRGSGILAGQEDRGIWEAKKRLVAEFADAIEVCNSKLPDRDNERAFALARELRRSIAAGADAHFGYDVGDAV